MAHPDVREGAGGPSQSTGVVGRPTWGSRRPPGGPVRVGKPTLRSCWGREAHPVVREGSGGPPPGPGRGRETHPAVREGSGGPPEGPGGIGRLTGMFGSPTRRSKRGREAHPEVREG